MPSKPGRQRRRKAACKSAGRNSLNAATAPKVTTPRPQALTGHALADVRCGWGLALFYSEVFSCVDPGAPLR